MKRPPCNVEGCSRARWCRNLCQMHYARWQKHGDPNIRGQGGRKASATVTTCSVEGCENPTTALGYCNAHRIRLRRHGSPTGGATPRGEVVGSPARFLEEVVLPNREDACLFWPFAINSRGYAHGKIEDDWWGVHRYVCIEVHGPPPTPDHEAAHSCGNGHLACIAPVHLRWATPSENYSDRLGHGTDHRGEKHPNAKLTEADVREIRLSWPRRSQKDLAETFGVTASAIGAIVHRKRWSWLKDD